MNLTSVLFDQVESRPDALAIRYGGLDLSYIRYADKVLAAAFGLKGLGIARNHVVGIELTDPLAHLTASLALAHIGAISVSIPRSMASPQREYLFNQTNCGALLTECLQDSIAGSPNCRILPWANIERNTVTLSDFGDKVSEDQSWTFVLGSGSTGRAKILPVSHTQQVYRAKLGSSWLPYGPNDILLSLVSMNFYAAKQRALEAFSRGAGLYLDRPGCIDHYEVVELGEVNAIYATVVHIEKLLNILPEKKIPHYAKLQALMVGGSAVSTALRKRIQDQLTSKIYVLWGTNETSTSTIAEPSSVFLTEGTVGRPFPNIDVEIVDNIGNPVEKGSEGLIRVSTPGMIKGYFKDSVQTKKSFQDGWFNTGDRGYLKDNGELVVLGRADDMMNVGGVNLFPADIENRLKGFPKVLDAVALPIRYSQMSSDIPVALIESEPGVVICKTTLIDYVRAHVGAHALHDVRFVEKIPRNEQGKIQRKQIDEIVQQFWNIENDRAMSVDAVSLVPSMHGSGALKILFSCPNDFRPTEVIQWLCILDENLSNHAKFLNCEKDVDKDLVWLEHMLLLTQGLLNVLGIPLFDPFKIIDFGKSKNTSYNSVSNILLPEAWIASRPLIEAVLKVAFKHGAWLASADASLDVNRERFFNTIRNEILEDFFQFRSSGKSTFQVLRTAHEMGISYRRIPGGSFQLGWGKNARLIDRSTTDRDSNIGNRLAADKFLTALWLREAGLPAPDHMSASELPEARRIAEKFGFPVVIKPLDCERGEGVSVDVTAEGLEMAFQGAKRVSPSQTVLVERQVVGVCHRLFIVAGQLLYAVKRLPIGIYADGQSTIESLVENEVKIQASLPPWKRSGISPLDDMAIKMLTRQGWTSRCVPPLNVFVALRRIETTAWGGVDEEITSIIHPENVKAALAATSLFRLEVAGVDIISDDISQPWHENGAIINEINYAPLLGGAEISRRHIGRYLDRILKDRGRIPIHVYIGGDQAWAEGQKHWKQLCKSGLVTYLTNDCTTFDELGASIPIVSGRLRRRLDALRLRCEIEALVVVVQSVQCLQDAKILDYVTSCKTVGTDPTHSLRNPQNVKPSLIINMIKQNTEKWSSLNT